MGSMARKEMQAPRKKAFSSSRTCRARTASVLSQREIPSTLWPLRSTKTGRDLVIRKTQFKRLLMVSNQQLFHLPRRLGDFLAILFMLTPSLSDHLSLSWLQILVKSELMRAAHIAEPSRRPKRISCITCGRMSSPN